MLNNDVLHVDFKSHFHVLLSEMTIKFIT